MSAIVLAFIPRIFVFVSKRRKISSREEGSLTKISSRKTTLIVDSLNGLYNFIDDDNPARFVNSLIMLLTTNAKFSKSILFVTCLGQKKDGDWMSSMGRHILEFENVNRFEINEIDAKSEIKAI